MSLQPQEQPLPTLSPSALAATWQAVKPFLNGGVAGMASISIIQPIDMVKVRIQLGATGSPVGTIAKQRRCVEQCACSMSDA